MIFKKYLMIFLSTSNSKSIIIKCYLKVLQAIIIKTTINLQHIELMMLPSEYFFLLINLYGHWVGR